MESGWLEESRVDVGGRNARAREILEALISD
jgi:hypothetical protein